MAKYATMFFIPENVSEILPELSGRYLTAWQFEDLKALASDSRLIASSNLKKARNYDRAAAASIHEKEYWSHKASEHRICATRHRQLANGRIIAIRKAIVREALPA